MKTKGRNICDTLKAIRKQIADANGIDYSPEECHFKGECKGTCPRCEQDVRDLEHELRIRQMAGKAIKVAGVALGITALAASTTSCATQKGYYSSISEKALPILFQEYTPNDSVLLKEKEALNKKGVLFVQGHLIDEQGDPQVGATITAKLSGSKTIADKDGNFTIEVEKEDIITVKYLGMQDRIIKITKMSQEKLNIITLTESRDVLGEVAVIRGTAPIIKKDTHSEEAKQEKYTNDGKTAIIQQTVASDSTKSSKLFGAAIEEMASFPGGSAALMQYIAQNLRYPNIQGDCNIQGRVIVGLTVNEDGTLSDIKVMKSISPTFDEEAIRVVKSMPKWNPAKRNGQAVKTKYTVPVTFRLE